MKKDWIARELTVEVVVGVFMVLILFSLAWFTFVLSGKKWGQEKHYINVCFQDVMGLREKDNVVVRGMPIGEIEKLTLIPGGKGVRLKLKLDKPVFMREGYRITIVSTSILGGRYLQLDEGPKENKPLEGIDVFIGEEPYDLMADAAELVNAVKLGVVEGGVIDNLRESSKQLKEIIERLNSGEGSLGKLLSPDEKLYSDVEATAAAIREITEKINNGEGMIGKLISDDGMYEDIQAIMDEVSDSLDDYRETSPVVTFTSIFFGAF